MENSCQLGFYNNICNLWRSFPKFYEISRAHERENQIARCHLISMVCTLVNYMQLSTNQRARNRSVVVKYIFMPDRE